MRITASLCLGVAITASSVIAQSISPWVIGENAWMETNGGQIDALWGRMRTAKYGFIRIGGSEALTDNQSVPFDLKLIDSIRAMGAEPMVQVPSNYSQAQAADFITQINVTNARHVRYWSIGNEPDYQTTLGSSAIPAGVDLSPAGVGAYTRDIAQGLRSVDTSITIFAGEFAWYDATYLSPLLGGSADITGKDPNGRYYIDGISWHHYADTSVVPIENEVNQLLVRFAKFNPSRPAGRKLQWMIGEFNSHYDNTLAAPDFKTWTFQTGQLFAAVYDLGMRKGAFTISPWSMWESGGARVQYDLGIFDGSNGTYSGRSSYWHGLMLGQNLKQNYLSHTSNQGAVTVVSMGDSSGTAVMLLNTSASLDLGFALRLNSDPVVQNRALKVSVDAGLAVEDTGTLARSSTQMLVFDRVGRLVKRYTYTSANADQRTGPVVESFAPTSIGEPRRGAGLSVRSTVGAVELSLPDGSRQVRATDLRGRILWSQGLSGEARLRLPLAESGVILLEVAASDGLHQARVVSR